MQNITDKNYNGWTNYETWNIKLWMDNSQGDQEYWRDRALNWLAISLPSQYFTKQEQATLDLAKEIKENHEDFIKEHIEQGALKSSFMIDLLNSAMSEVNWYEIAKSLIEDTN